MDSARSTSRGPWFPYYRPQPEARGRLLCLPCAGGAASAFRPWQLELQPGLEVLSVQYPGRETRFGQPHAQSVQELVEGIAAQLSTLPPLPLIILGHSFGALLGYELCRLLEAAGTPPLHFAPAGASPPHLLRPVMDEQLGDAELTAYLRRLGGLPPHVLENRELLALVLPVIRADLLVYGRYRFVPSGPLRTPLTVLGGAEDPLTSPQRLEAWGPLATDCSVRLFPGDHAFVHTARTQVISELGRVLFR